MADEAEWTGEQIIIWLACLGIGEGLALDIPAFQGPYIPEMPDELLVVTPIAGAGETMEGIGDVPGFQLLTRGAQGHPSSGESTAKRADRLIRFSPFPMDVAGGALRLLRVVRSGSGPAALAAEDDADRISFTCNYLTEILR